MKNKIITYIKNLFMESINTTELAKKIQDGEFKINRRGHITGDIIQKLEESKYDKYTTLGKPFKQHWSGNSNVMHCFHCGENIPMIPLSEKILTLVNLEDIDNLPYNPKLEDIPMCKAHWIQEQGGMFKATINVPSGEILFANYFNTDKLYVDKKHEFDNPTINCSMGQNRLMQYLAKQNVGYGQMGNMGLTIFSNGKNEIIVGERFDNYYYDEEGEAPIEEKNLYASYLKYLENGNFQEIGEISCSVWRWQCADKEILKKYKEDNKFTDEDVVAIVEKGTYEIEHYFNNYEQSEPLLGNHIYSRLKLVQ